MTIEELKDLVIETEYRLVFGILKEVKDLTPQDRNLCNELAVEFVSGKTDKHFATRLLLLIDNNASIIAPAIQAIPVPITKKRRRTFFWFFSVVLFVVIAVIVYMSLPKEVIKETAQKPTPQTPKDSGNTKPSEKTPNKTQEEIPKEVPKIEKPKENDKNNEEKPQTPALQKSSLPLKGYQQTSIYVNKGDLVNITATGTIYFGSFVKELDANGADWVMDMYDIAPRYNHGALLYKIGTETDWEFAGASKRFQADASGFLIFEINDRDKGNNSGSFNVAVYVEK